MKIILLTILSTLIYANTMDLDNDVQFYDLLPYSSIYIDNSKNLTIKDIKTKNKEFKKNDKKLLGYGYSPDFNVWIKFTLKNNTNKDIEKILEYANPLTTDISLFDISKNKEIKEGLLNIDPHRKTLTPIFKLKIKPYESKTYYLKVTSYITTLIVKLNVWDTVAFYEKEIRHQLFLALFFGSMFILFIYNLFIYFFTKDISYLYYVLYIFGITLHHSMYVGLTHLYFISDDWMIYFIKYASIFVAFPVFALALFTKYFLHIQQYPILNKVLNIFLILIPISTFVFIMTDDFDKYRNVLILCLFLYLIILTVYNAFKRNRQAYFILAGWFIIFIAMFLMLLSSGGIFNIYKYFPYVVETSLVLEGIIFSIALADRINGLQNEKNIANDKLITQQQNEKERLKISVSEKTKDLKIALDEKGLLLKELNHRVKNNMQTIVSLIRLQSDEVEDEKLQDVFVTIQNRINAMSHLHELLYKQDNVSHVNAYEYFDLVIEELQDSYDNDIDISFDIQIDLKMEQAIYCGLILNELVTNSFKYAFPNKEGKIDIRLFQKDNNINLCINDNGIGYDKNIPSNSLGLTLVNTLAKNQLKGNIAIDSSHGVKVEIIWKI